MIKQIYLSLLLAALVSCRYYEIDARNPVFLTNKEGF